MGYKEKIASNNKRYRNAAGMNQRDLAAKIGVTSGAISNWEKGNNSIDIDTLVRVCWELNVSLDDMCGFNEEALRLSNREEELVRAYRRCTPERQDIILELVGIKRDTRTSGASNKKEVANGIA